MDEQMEEQTEEGMDRQGWLSWMLLIKTGNPSTLHWKKNMQTLEIRLVNSFMCPIS